LPDYGKVGEKKDEGKARGQRLGWVKVGGALATKDPDFLSDGLRHAEFDLKERGKKVAVTRRKKRVPI